MKEKNIILAARVLSMLFTPFYLPLVAMVAMFVFSYLSILDLSYKLIVLTLVYAMTILLPTLLIHTYRNYQGWTSKELGVKERRMIPYIISILCYFLCFYVMNIFHMPAFMGSIVVAALFIQIVCAIINIWWKISTHTAAIGGFFGALSALSLIFDFNPLWWLCLVLLLAGLVGTSRMILRQHTLAQVVMGFLTGAAVGCFMFY
ncbi:MAG: phosphatase PAP2 family protein [Bacteroidales bacterium]|nr:phosphatase PAP2 family protein [Bacteroidales bacterium]MDY4705492.1 phosphatase PAP2 family protein [Prevotella sp.]MCI6101875.1 phosphatase PAP2 family protein [Bacteroidales bacterium]MCI7653134.1 phosphatase PAP2 family protein [Bacteroidales bacterium]MDD7705678.1 phosphatase PAP2 family protein [Bacteroidales bacterium]